MARRQLTSGLLIFVLASAALEAGWGQIPHSQVVFAYLGLSIESPQLKQSLRDNDVQVLENRIKGCLLDIARQENYSLATPPNAAQMLGFLKQRQNAKFQAELLAYSAGLTANGVLAFRVSQDQQSLLRLFASMYAVPGGEAVNETDEGASNLDGLLERVPVVVYALFGLPLPSASDKLAQVSRPSMGAFTRERDLQLRDLVGNWQGDNDQAKVEIHPDGSGLIWLNDTDTMRVRVVVEAQTVTVRQDEPNSPKLYLSVFPYTIAVQVVRLARPMSWEFRVTPELDRMVGKKETSYFYIEQSKVLQVDNTYSRDAVWIRMP